MQISEYLALLSIQYHGDYTKISKAIASNQQPNPTIIKDKYISIYDDLYPQALKQLRYPPWVLFYQGNINLLRYPKACIIGSRDVSQYGRNLTILTTTILRQHFVTVSGLADGVDGIVHQTTIGHGHTIGVIGSGLSIQYPRINSPLYQYMSQHDLILSEYPHDTGIQKHHFPWRNRILAALGEFTVVTQAKERSGTSLTVNEAFALGKDVYCFPYPFGDEGGVGCNKFIADGAMLLYSEEQLKQLRPRNTIIER